MSPLSLVFDITKGVGVIVDSGGNDEIDVEFKDSIPSFGFEEKSDGAFDVFDVTAGADAFMLADGLPKSP